MLSLSLSRGITWFCLTFSYLANVVGLKIEFHSSVFLWVGEWVLKNKTENVRCGKYVTKGAGGRQSRRVEKYREVV